MTDPGTRGLCWGGDGTMALSQVGYYQIDRLLGEGGMGAVYQATHRMTGRRVAVKTLRAELADRVDLNGRFFNEARTMSFLEHPSIVQVHDVGRTSDGTAYMVMDLCEGETLGEVLRKEPSPAVKLGLLAAVADALSHAHEHGVVHRDLKPDNVIVTPFPEGLRPRVLDFGIAKVLDGAIAAGSPYAVKTRTGTAMGTPLYMSPEQCRGVGGITQATDVYSLGIMLFEALAGRVPFDGGVGEVIVQHITTPAPTLPAEALPEGGAALGPLVARMLEKDAGLRPTMRAVNEALRAYALPPGALSLEEAGGAREAPALARPLPIPASLPLPVEAPPARPATDTGSSTLSPPPGRTVAPRPSARAPSAVIPLAIGLLVAASAIGLALVSRRGAPTPPSVAAAPRVTSAAAGAPDLAPPAVRAVAARWRIQSTPPGADVFATDGTLLGRTPYVADAQLERGERLLYVRRRGYEDEIVRYDASGSSIARMRDRAAAHALPRARPTPNHDDFEITPLH